MNFMKATERVVRGVFSWQYPLLLCTAVALALAYAPASRAQIVLGPSISLSDLTNGEDLIVGDKQFTDFSISGDFQASQVSVIPISENGNFGIRFSGPFVAGDNAMDMILGYKVSVTNSPDLISAANLLFNGTVVGPGLAEVVEQVFTNNNEFAGQMYVFASATTNKLFDSLAIQPPQTLLTLSKDVIVEATLPAFATISTIDQSFTQVPEPSTVALMAAGFAGLVCLRRRR